ncbi:MAG: M1 family metallopeptidase [Oscillatoria sp. PMC 1068.18]|nr:M1 family metallopeptidase [Oscillatoria sp. PMC 1076.18]MEC4987255.1 M1 family metallopeptidase [Oscillatoria sp. PMC 1068.18]
MLHSYYFDTEDNNKRSFELPGAKPQYNPDRPGQVEHIFLDLVLDIPNQSFHGTCTITIQPVVPGITSLTLDAVNLKIDSVLVDKISQPFDYDDEKLQIQLLQPTTEAKIEIAIAYRVDQPQRGLYFVTPDSDYPDKPTQIWTQGEDEDSRFWFPCFDYPGQLATSEIRVQVPQPYIAISNGELISKAEKDQTIIYHWRQKQIHPTYLMTLAVGDFAEIEDEWNNIPVTYYVEKGKEADAQRSMGKTPRMLEFFSDKYGYNYAYPKYAQVCVADFIFGGMENTSTTLLTDRCLIDDRAEIDNQRTESLVAHELAHQWFGDLVVIKHWSHAWIKEGAASYSEVQWTEHEYGKDDAAYYLLNEARSYISEDTSRYRRPIVTNIYREAIELYDRHLYEKGACVYHMIRATLGDELFDKAIHSFVRENAHKTVETIDLLRAIETATGRNLAPLFDQYVFRGGHPDYQVSYSWDNKSKLAKLSVTQKQAKKDTTGSKSELFDLTIPLGFGYVDKSNSVEFQTMSLRIHEKEQTFYFPLENKPKFVSFDFGNNLLKTVSLEYPVANLKAQLKYDPDPISRIYAAAALSKKGGLEAVKALAEALQNDAFWGVRVEVAKELGKIKLDQATQALIGGLADENTKVRRAVINSLSKFKTSASYEKIKQIAEKGDVSYYTEATAIRCLGEMVAGNLKEKEADVLAFFQEVLQTRSGWNEVVRCGAISGLSQMKTSPEAVEIILEYTQPGVPQALRLAAIRGLGTVSTGQSPAKLELILEQLEAIIAETFFLTQVAVVSGLEQMETEKAIAQLQALANQTADGRVRRRAEEAVKKVQRKIGSDKALQKLREDLEQLKQENQELKSRVAKLEAED